MATGPEVPGRPRQSNSGRPDAAAEVGQREQREGVGENRHVIGERARTQHVGRRSDAGAAVVRETIAKRDAWLTSRIRKLPAEQRAVLVQAAEILDRLATE